MCSFDAACRRNGLAAACATWLLAACGNGQPGSLGAVVVPHRAVGTASAATRPMSIAQAEALTVTLSGEVLWVDVGGEAVMADCVDSTLTALDESALPRDTPVFVTGNDERLAAAATRQLGRAGLSQVFLVAR